TASFISLLKELVTSSYTTLVYKYQAPTEPTLRAGISRDRSLEREHRSTAVALTPRDFGVDHAGPRANVGHAAAGILFVAAVKATTVIFDRQFKCVAGRDAGAHLNVPGARVAADVTQGFLRNSINLNLHARRQIEFFVERIIANE